MLSGFVFLFSIYLVGVTVGQEFLKNSLSEVGNPFFRTVLYYKSTKALAPAQASAPTSATIPPTNQISKPFPPQAKLVPPPTKTQTQARTAPPPVQTRAPAPQPSPGPKFAPRPSPVPAPAPQSKDHQQLTRTQSREIARIVRKLKLTIKGKIVNPNANSFQTDIADYLFGQTVPERAKVWDAMAKLRVMFAKANNEKIEKKPSYDIEQIAGVLDDMILDYDDLKDMLAFYAINPNFLKLDGKSKSAKEKTARGAFLKRAKKWKMPIQYKIKSRKKRPVKSKPIKDAIAAWEKDTCIRFKQRKANANIKGPNIVFRWHRKKCCSRIGKKIGTQSIRLATHCQKKGKIMHEIGHALGFIHEQSRHDRNTYVEIIKKNIKPLKRLNFIRFKKVDTYGFPYDYSSIMHYWAYAFSKNPDKLKTIRTLPPVFEKTIGQRNTLSFFDVKAANRRYCNGKCKGGLESSKCKNGGYKNPNKCKHCICPDGWRGQYCNNSNRSRPDKTSCGKTSLNAKVKKNSLTSPGYNKDGYTSKNECSWRIRAPPGQRVRFKFKGTFKLRCNTPCKDFVEVRYSSTSKPGPRYCCSKRPKRLFVSRGNVMLINFRTFSGKDRKGFKAEYYTTTLPISAGNV